MLDSSIQASKEFIEFQRGVVTAMAFVDALQNVLLNKGILTNEELQESRKAVLKTDYFKGRMAEYDKAIKEIEEYEKMDFGDLFSSLFDSKMKRHSDSNDTEVGGNEVQNDGI